METATSEDLVSLTAGSSRPAKPKLSSAAAAMEGSEGRGRKRNASQIRQTELAVMYSPK